MEMNSENWEEVTPLPNMEAELKRIRKDIRRRNWRIVLTSLVLVIAVLFGAVKFAMPALESTYWDPTVCSYIDGVTDLELSMNIYNELFGHGKHMLPLEVKKTGFADYSIDTFFVEWKNMHSLSSLSSRTASVTTGELNFSTNFWHEFYPGIFGRDRTLKERYVSENKKYTINTLKELPDYIQVYASITFSEDLTMEQLSELDHAYSSSEARFLWAILCSQDGSDEYRYPCGVHLTEYSSSRYNPTLWKDTDYPDLFVDRDSWTPQAMEQHILSMLKFSADQLEQGTGVVCENDDPNYYQKVLDYFEENGIKTYGCYIIATPETLLDLIDSGIVYYTCLIDAWIGI